MIDDTTTDSSPVHKHVVALLGCSTSQYHQSTSSSFDAIVSSASSPLRISSYSRELVQVDSVISLFTWLVSTPFNIAQLDRQSELLDGYQA